MKNLHFAFTPKAGCCTSSTTYFAASVTHFSSSTRPAPHLLTALAPCCGEAQTLCMPERTWQKSRFSAFSACFIAARLCLPTLLVQTTTVAKNWCFCSQPKASFQETLRRQFGMIGPRLLEPLPLEELNPEMKIRCVFKIEVWRALEKSGCFGFRSGELQQNSTRVCKPHQKQPFTCTSFDGRQSNIS